VVVQVWRKAYGAADDDGDTAWPWLPLRRQTPGFGAHGADRAVSASIARHARNGILTADRRTRRQMDVYRPIGAPGADRSVNRARRARDLAD